jgi:hypothetical protein
LCRRASERRRALRPVAVFASWPRLRCAIAAAMLNSLIQESTP